MGNSVSLGELFGASLLFGLPLLDLLFSIVLTIIAIVSFCFCIWEFIIRYYLSPKTNNSLNGIELKEPLTIEELLLKLRNNLDFPELIKLYYDDKTRIVAECAYSTSIIYIENNKVYVVPKGYASKIAFSKSVENSDCLRKCVEKALDHTAPIDATASFRLFKSRRNKHTAIKIISIILFFISIWILVPKLVRYALVIFLLLLGYSSY